MQPPTLSLSMMHFDRDELMAVDESTSTLSAGLVAGASPLEVDLMLSLMVQPESITIGEQAPREFERLAG